VIDFDKMFEANGLSPLPDAELKELLAASEETCQFPDRPAKRR
jgi:hypothetical protein